MANNRKLSTNDTALVLQNDYSEILQCYTNSVNSEGRSELVPREVRAAAKLDEIRSRNDKNYVDKLLHLAVTSLNDNSRIVEGRLLHRSSNTVYTVSDGYVSIVFLLAKYADLSCQDEQGNKPANHILQKLIGNEANFDKHLHRLRNVECEFSYRSHEIFLKLLHSLLNKQILNSPYKWGYSYFGVLVLLGWWDAVRWGLKSGADVSDNGVCPYLPIDAACASTIHGLHAPEDIFVKLLHPTNINRPIIPGPNGSQGPFQKFTFPLHLVARYHYLHKSMPHLLDAGAHIDSKNQRGELPVEIFTRAMPLFMEPHVFHRLVSHSAGISPTVFLHVLQMLNEHYISFIRFSEMGKNKFFNIFSEHLQLSSDWQELSISEILPSERYCMPGFLIFSINGIPLKEVRFDDIIRIIDIFTKFGIRARNMPSFVSVPADSGIIPLASKISVSQHSLDEVENKWNEYRTFIPSLFLQCVREIRSSLRVVTDERVQKLPIPVPIQKIITLKEVMEEKLSDFETSS